MHPYITQALMNERVADMHAAAAAARRTREARRLTRLAAKARAAASRSWTPINEVPRQARLASDDRPAQAARGWRSEAGGGQRASAAGRHEHRGAAGVAVTTRVQTEAGDTGADSQALCGTGRGR